MAENWWENDETVSPAAEGDDTLSFGEDDETVVPSVTNTPTTEPEKDAISTQMYEGMSFEEANDYYNQILQNPNVEKASAFSTAVYTDPETGRKEYIPRPQPDMLTAAGKAIVKTMQAPFSDEVSLSDAKDAFLNPDAKVSNTEKIGMGMAESLGATVEAGAALAEKAGVEGALDAVDPLVVNVDTGDSIKDAILTDAIPAVAMAFAGGAGAQQVVAGMPKILRGLGVVLSAETAASVGMSTDEGTLALGDNAAFPMLKGIDLGSDEADAILEQRLNTLAEGMFINTTLAGVIPTVAGGLKLAGKFTILPLLTAGSESAMERRVWESITDKLGNINMSTTPEQRAAIKNEIAEIVEANKKILVPRLTDLAVDDDVQIDTISAILRSTDDPEATARISGLRAGQIQKGGADAPKTIAATEEPQRVLQQQMEAYLADVAGENPTGTIAGAADDLAASGREAVAQSDSRVATAQDRFDAAAQDVVDSINSADVELTGQLSRLEDVTGTDIVRGQEQSFEQVRDGLMTAKATMTRQKDALYDAIPEGTPFDIEAFGEALKAAVTDANAFDDTGKQLLGKRLINTLRSAYNKTQTTQGVDAFGAPTDAVENVPIEQIIEEIAASGVDFKVLYNQIKPALSKLADEAYRNGANEVGSRLVVLRKSIDEQVEWIAENGSPEAAEAATKAKDYFQNTFSPIWRDGGKMEEFGDMYDPVITRGTQEAGFRENSRELITSVLSGSNPDAVVNMARALDQVADDKPIADYMIADVINGFASAVRTEGMNAETLKTMSDRLRQYSSSLNAAFGDRATQINQLIANIENAAGNQRQLQEALAEAEQIADQTRKDVKASALGRFMSKLYGRELDTTTNPINAFTTIFNEAEGIGTVSDIMAQVKTLPPERAAVVRDGIEAAYLRYLSDKITGAKMQSAGTQDLKSGVVDKTLEGANNILAIGREVFADKPEFMETISTLLEASRMIQKQKQAQPVQGMSPTVFNQEATKATNRMIMVLIGPLSRLGAQVRSVTGAAFDAMDSTKRASQILDRMLAEPDYFLEMTRKYNANPMDPLVEENLITALTAGVSRTANVETEGLFDSPNSDQQMEELLGYQ